WTTAGGGVGSSSRPNSTSNNVRVVRSCAVALETSTPDRSTRTMARTQAWKTDIRLFSLDRPAPKAVGSKNGGAVVTGVEVFFPFIGHLDNAGEVVMTRLPSQRLDPIGPRNDGSGIAWPPGAMLDGKVNAGHTFDGRNHLIDREPAPIDEIDRAALPALAQMLEQQPVCRDQIGDVDIVAHAGAIGGGIVVAENAHL